MHTSISALFLACALSATKVAATSCARSNQCNVKGYDTQTNAYYYDSSGSTAGYTRCSARCLSDSQCQSFAYDSDKTCMHFNVPVEGNFESDNDSTFHFYDKGCISIASATSTKVVINTTPPSTTKLPPIPTTTSTKSSIGAKSSTPSANKTSSPQAGTTTATAKITSTAASTTSTTLPSTKVTIPSGCPIPSAYTVTSFNWFNSTHNLDCAGQPDIGDGTGCLKLTPDGQNSIWCDPRTDKDCTHCGIGVCMTGLPPQPIGYGPPDVAQFVLSEGTTCTQMTPAVVHRYEVGEGFLLCGGAYDFLNFYGSSNAATQMGTVEINGYTAQCADGDTIAPYYITQFQIDCTHDKQFNATCTTPKAFDIPLVRFNKFKQQIPSDGDDGT